MRILLGRETQEKHCVAVEGYARSVDLCRPLMATVRMPSSTGPLHRCRCGFNCSGSKFH